MDSNFNSKLGDQFSSYLQFKRSLGYQFSTGERLLRQLDRFVEESFPDSEVLSEEIVHSWGFPEGSTSLPQTLNKRLALLTDLGKFLHIENEHTYVLSKKTRYANEQAFPCRILTEEEVVALFSAADAYGKNASVYTGITLSVMLRLLYATGLRPGEVMRLRTSHFNYDKKELLIIESKGLYSRRIVIGNDLASLLARYIAATGAPGVSDELYLFTANGDRSKMLQSSWLNKRLKKLCSDVNLKKPYPRSYDFRHTFITTRILKWIQTGEDINVKLPFLKIFVGHKSINDTWYYFKLIPEHTFMLDSLKESSNSIIPDVDEDAYEQR